MSSTNPSASSSSAPAPSSGASSSTDASDATAAAAAAAAAAHDGTGLILHWDLNGTVTPIDSVDAGEASDLIGMFLAKYTFGRVDPASGEWTIDSLQPAHPSSPRARSFYNHLRGQPDWHEGRTYTFAREGNPGETMAHLAERLHGYYKAAERERTAGADPSPNAEAEAEQCGLATAPSTDGEHSSTLFPSFLRVLRRYPRAKLVFRTFGHDTQSVVAAVNTSLRAFGMPQRSFSGFRLVRHTDAQGKVQELELEALLPLEQQPAVVQFDNALPDSSASRVRGTVADLGAFLDNLSGDAFVLDHYHYWNARGRKREHGKPIFPTAVPNGIVLAFDDNPCMQLPEHDTKPADTTQPAGATSSASSASVSSAPAPSASPSAAARMRFVRVRPVLALQHENYFVQHIDEALREHA